MGPRFYSAVGAAMTRSQTLVSSLLSAFAIRTRACETLLDLCFMLAGQGKISASKCEDCCQSAT